MTATPVLSFDDYKSLEDDACQARIVAARARLGARATILGHHYQRADVYQHADLTGDSLGLSRLAAQTEAEYIVFCGVHFMAEVADILTKPHQVAILPDLSAGCSMADMASLAKVERAWREISEVLDPDEHITPITYINSAADLKAFCGEHGGIVCTSSNARSILEWAFARRDKVLFFPDQHLGRWTGYLMDIPVSEMLVWDPDEPMGGLTAQQIKMAKVLLWKGHCSVHQTEPREPACRPVQGPGQGRAVHGADRMHVLDDGAHRPAAPGLVPREPRRRPRGEPHHGAREGSRARAPGADTHARGVVVRPGARRATGARCRRRAHRRAFGRS